MLYNKWIEGEHYPLDKGTITDLISVETINNGKRDTSYQCSSTNL